MRYSLTAGIAALTAMLLPMSSATAAQVEMGPVTAQAAAAVPAVAAAAAAPTIELSRVGGMVPVVDNERIQLSVNVVASELSPLTSLTISDTLGEAQTQCNKDSLAAGAKWHCGWIHWVKQPETGREPFVFTATLTALDAAGLPVQVSSNSLIIPTSAVVLPSISALAVVDPQLSAQDTLRFVATIAAPADFEGRVQLLRNGTLIAEENGGGEPYGDIFQDTLSFALRGSRLLIGNAQYSVRLVSHTLAVARSVSGPLDVQVYFHDKLPGTKFYGEVLWLADRGISKGVAGGAFDPTGPVSRKTMAAFLYRLKHPGLPVDACTAKPFPDITIGSQFCGEITWLAKKKITSGFADGKFKPAVTVDRQATAALLYRLASPHENAKPKCTSAPFVDVPRTHPFCGEISWLKTQHIAEGNPDGTFRPSAKVSREAMSAFLYRFAANT